jgi:hypothetical protein
VITPRATSKRIAIPANREPAVFDVGMDTAPGIPDEDDREDAHHEVARVAITVYAVITLLGVLEAATLKKLAATEVDLIAVLVGASLAIAVAHMWSTVMANRLVHRVFTTGVLFRRELRVVGSYFLVTLLCVVTVLGGEALGMAFDETVRMTEGLLIAGLFGLGVLGARGSGAGWARSLGWGVLDASIGLAIVLVKVIAGG